VHDDDEGEQEQEETFSGLFHFFLCARDGYCARARVFLKKGVLGNAQKSRFFARQTETLKNKKNPKLLVLLHKFKRIYRETHTQHAREDRGSRERDMIPSTSSAFSSSSSDRRCRRETRNDNDPDERQSLLLLSQKTSSFLQRKKKKAASSSSSRDDETSSSPRPFCSSL